ncbi:anti-sigma factor family protein [Streptomyces lunaelactis]|uniref:anti-sigma factor family protein n=1 Tax=Streptomyces lunaelactis TaxID=1535768 RepID=UPI0015845C1C|nr:zf-HC2 domain-containing protein [Streptomyces lunaelactis]NUK01273.1 zf-HC2 domain-containing protein [Streptomyces lunaelactis]NUK15245.1 zf-HC2 domain-containing protein [Streptomyces lunaelactis]
MTSTTDTTQHPDVSEISDLTEGLLSPARTAEVRQHLDGCPLCADVRTSLDEIRGLLGTLPGAHRMPADFAGRIDAALAAEALLDATAPEETAHVSRETTPVTQQTETTPADRPAGRPRAATGPGRNHRTRRRRAVVLGAVFSAAAVGISVLFLQGPQSTGGDASATKDSASSAEGGTQDFSQSGIEGRVQALIAPALTQHQDMEKGTSSDTRSAPVSPKRMPGVTVPPCIQKGTGRTDTPIAFERGQYKGDSAYLVVLPHSTDGAQVQAYVVDAACVETAPASTGKLLLTNAYPRA